MAAVAVEAVSACKVEGQHNPIAFLDALNCFSNLLDYAHNFVSNHGAFLEWGPSVIHMKITSADTSCRDPENCISWRIYSWFRFV
jgi:hypothetical protein